MRVRIVEIFGLEVCTQTFIQNFYEFVEGARLTCAEVVNSTNFCVERANGSFNSILHVNEIALLLAMLENARSLTRLYLLRQMINHARGDALVCFARSVNIEVTQPDHDPVRRLGGSLSCN